jgi:hypothetical protein
MTVIVLKRIWGMAIGLQCVLLMGMPVTPVVAQTPAASPASPSAADETEGSLAGMLGRLPNLPLQDGTTVAYADIAAQLAALGIASEPDGDSDEQRRQWAAALAHLSLPTTAEHWGRPEWRQAFGFDIYQIDRAVMLAPPPPGLIVALRGRFDPDELRAAWTRSGYQPVDLGAGEAYAVREDFEIDLSDPNSRMAMANLNVVALAEDGTLIFSSTRDGVRGALAASSGDAPSLAERPGVTSLVSASPPDLASALIIPGTMLQFAPDVAALMQSDESPEAFATRTAEEAAEASRMPPVAAALLGVTVGTSGVTTASTPPSDAQAAAEAVAVLVMVGAEAATAGAAVIEDRLTNDRSAATMGGDLAGLSWTEIYSAWSVEALPEDAAIRMTLTPASGAPVNLLPNLLFTRTPSFLSWSP